MKQMFFVDLMRLFFKTRLLVLHYNSTRLNSGLSDWLPQNPVVHFDLPVRLEKWFPRQRVRQKRKEIGSLIMKMHRSQNEET